MKLLDFKKKNYLIASKNNILLHVLADNTSYAFTAIQPENLPEKIDILIVDSELAIDPANFYQINIIINLTNNKIVEKEITIRKPFYLQGLITLIDKNAEDNSLFCAINNNWIYNERARMLLSKNDMISLTDKENDLFKNLLVSREYTTDKEALRKTVWDYHQATESTTIETHIYKLKQKLPKGLLEIKNSSYSLNL